LFLALVVLAGRHYAQDSVRVALIDRQSGEPIAGAVFRYGAQAGPSDERGNIVLRFTEGADLVISHVGYGTWTVLAVDIGDVRGTLRVVRDPVEFTMFPVEIIAVRPESMRSDLVRLDYQERLAHDGGEVLNRVPSIASVRKSGTYGFDPVLRGFKYDQITVLLDGAQTASAACPNRMDPPTSQMAPNMTDAIQVLKGPHALRYGNAVGGTINFVSSQPRFGSMPGPSGRLSGSYDGNGDVMRSEGSLGWSGEDYDLSLFGAYAQGNDYADGDGLTVQSDFLRSSIGAKIGLLPGAHHVVGISATRNLARDADFPALQMDLRKDDTWMVNARHDLTFGPGSINAWTTVGFGTFVEHLMDNGMKQLNPRMADVGTSARTRAFGARTEGTIRWDRSELIAGADLRREEAEGTRTREFLMGPNAGRIFYDNVWQGAGVSKAALFGEYRTPLGAVTLVISGRLEYNAAAASDASKEFTDIHPETDATQVNPGLSVGGLFGLDQEVSFGVWLARVQRSGGLTERYINYLPVGQDPYELLGDPQLAPEVNNEIDLTMAYKSRTTSFSIDLFAGYLQDYISTVIDPSLDPRMPTSPGVRRFVNLGRAFKTGFEVRWTQSLFTGLEQHLDVAYTYGQDLERGQPLPEIAPLDVRFSLAGDYLDNTLRPEVALRFVSAQSRVSLEYGETATPSFAVLDVSARYRLGRPLSLSAGVMNILDRAYYEHLNRAVQASPARRLYVPGRSVVVSLSLDMM
jgi:iron complex outermembrane receptor protein